MPATAIPYEGIAHEIEAADGYLLRCLLVALARLGRADIPEALPLPAAPENLYVECGEVCGDNCGKLYALA